jgi:spermidine synthase
VRGPTRTTVYDEAGERITVHDYGTHVDLLIGRMPIMTSKTTGTEDELGTLSRRLCARPAARVLVGGLGFGVTLGAVLRSQPPGARVLVVEKLQTVIDLVRGPLGRFAPGALEDPRVELIHGDVRHVLAAQRDLDVILLDVDNGPDWASFRSNASLYGAAGLASARAALVPGGSLAVWSQYAADRFLNTLRSAGFEPSKIPLHEHGRVRARAYVGTKPLVERAAPPPARRAAAPADGRPRRPRPPK